MKLLGSMLAAMLSHLAMTSLLLPSLRGNNMTEAISLRQPLILIYQR